MKILIGIMIYLVVGMIVMVVGIALSKDALDLWGDSESALILGVLVLIYPLLVLYGIMVAIGRLIIKLATKVKEKLGSKKNES